MHFQLAKAKNDILFIILNQFLVAGIQIFHRFKMVGSSDNQNKYGKCYWGKSEFLD